MVVVRTLVSSDRKGGAVWELWEGRRRAIRLGECCAGKGGDVMRDAL